MTDQAPAMPWLQLIIQCGSLGLLAWIVAKTVPEMILQARLERERKDDSATKMIDALAVQFEARNRAIVDSLERQTRAIADKLDQQTARLTLAIESARRVQRPPPRNASQGGGL